MTDAAQARKPAATQAAGGATLMQRVKSGLGIASRALDPREVIENALKRSQGKPDAFTKQERFMLRNILRFGALRVEDVMVPRADIVAVDETLALRDLLGVFSQAGHSRLPVYHETLDDPRGMAHVKDLMALMTAKVLADRPPNLEDTTLPEAATPRANGKSHEVEPDPDPAAPTPDVELEEIGLDQSIALSRLMRDVLFVPPSMSVVDLLLRMQATHIHLALVVDEYGGTDGLVSIEDLVEEIVGEIEDEHDVNGGPHVREEPKLGLVADARAEIAEVERIVGKTLVDPGDEDRVDTIGGLVFKLAGRIPVRGELVAHASGIEFEILDGDPRRIKKLRIHTRKRRPKAAAPRADAGKTPAAQPQLPPARS